MPKCDLEGDGFAVIFKLFNTLLTFNNFTSSSVCGDTNIYIFRVFLLLFTNKWNLFKEGWSWKMQILDINQKDYVRIFKNYKEVSFLNLAATFFFGCNIYFY